MAEPAATEAPVLRILGVSTSYPVRRGSSAGLFVHRLYRELSSSYEISVLCPGDRSGAYDRLNQGVSVRPVDYAPRRLRVLGGAGGILPAVRETPLKLLLLPALLAALFASVLRQARAADIIHANWAVCGMLAGVAGRMLGKPVVTTLRGDDITRASHSAMDRLLLDAAVRRSRKIICVSEAMAERLVTAYPERRADIQACLNGVDEAFFAVVRTAAPSSPLRVTAVGSLITRKAYDVLIRAVAQCRAREGIRLRLIGDGPCRQELRALCAGLGLSERIEFAGELDQDAIRRVLADSDLFVLPSRSEGRPNAVIEAVAAGLPVISSDLEGVRGLVTPERNGWLFPVDDISGLAACLDTAYDGRAKLPGMGETGRAALAVDAGWGRTARCYEAIFRDVMAAGAPR